MWFRRWHRRSRDLRRRLIAAVALFAYLVSTVGLPLPASVSKGGVPFPCQHHACGCATARECWEHCCCYSAPEKLAWARKHHVEPPARLVAEVAAIEADPLLASASAKTSHTPKACCAEHQSRAEDHDHSHAACGAACCHEHDEHEANSSGVTFVIGIKARQCRGLTDAWCSSGAVMPPPAVGWQFQWDVVGWLTLDAARLDSGDRTPPIPPPKV